MEILQAYPNAAFITAWIVGSSVLTGSLWLITRRLEVFAAKPMVAAYNMAHLAPVIAICYYGIVGRLDWITKQPGTLEERMYGFDPAAEKVCLLQIALNTFVTIFTLVSRDKALLKPELLGHHTVTIACMLLCLHPFGHSRVGIFFGLTELSTIPLNIVDTFKNFKGLAAMYPALATASRVTFGLSFLVLRVLLTGIVSYDFQLDLLELYQTGSAHSLVAVAFSSLSNGFVVALQLYWAMLIIKGLVKMINGKAKGG
eukprot:TRINITY_DN40217_c0_g1_i1.p1 TRINITY_DN40217_c0_g1~~TRINITY_DN40217_c0_g1_i1.p1  ORF type:complete len:267 (-),score=45.10 TRINITY_DN40217_c0_g1_i1:161-931(-)